MELIFQDLYEYGVCRIYAKVEHASRIVFLGYNGQGLIEQIYPATGEHVEILPLLQIPMLMKDDLIKAFVSQGAKSNLRTENENLLKGKLEAVEFHLSDMRDIAQKLLEYKLQQ